MKAMVEILKLIGGKKAAGNQGSTRLHLVEEIRKADRRSLPEEHEYSRFGYLIASDPATPSYVLAIMAKSAVTALQERIACNPNAEPSILQELACSNSVEVRQAVADHEKTPIETLLKLARDDSADVRFRLAENYHAPEEVLTILIQDENPYVECRAWETLNKLFQGEQLGCYRAA
jgi:hypothetical protein